MKLCACGKTLPPKQRKHCSAKCRANTSAQSQIVSRIEAMERRQDAMEARRGD